jgi:toxin ParE1/3/4
VNFFTSWLYTFEQWNAAQADRYLDELDDGIQQLADNPEMGAKRDYVREGYRVLFINSHAIYLTSCRPYHPGASRPDGPR